MFLLREGFNGLELHGPGDNQSLTVGRGVALAAIH
jgi:hypothetical protein